MTTYLIGLHDPIGGKTEWIGSKRYRFTAWLFAQGVGLKEWGNALRERRMPRMVRVITLVGVFR